MPSTLPAPSGDRAARRLPRLSFGLTWLIVLPAAAWGMAAYYLPIMGSNLPAWQNAGVTLAILLVCGLSLVVHVLAHALVQRASGKEAPAGISLLAFGDVAQRWRAADTFQAELLPAAVGPLANLLISGLAYLLWTRLSNNTLNLIVLFLCGFNAWLFLINLIPAFPMDGGRLVSAALSAWAPGLWKRRHPLQVLGWIMAAVLTGWGAFLILQNSRFSWDTGLITFVLVLLILDGGRSRPASTAPLQAQPSARGAGRLLRSIGTTLLGLILLAASAAFLLVNNGLEAPGVALPVSPMVQVPARYAHVHSGQFFLVTVVSQAPITAGEWLLGQVDPVFQIVPPETVTPKNTTPQKQAAQDTQMLDNSETTAIAVGLQLAGYPSVLVGKGVLVDSILAGSHANGLLKVGDVITAMNGTAVLTSADLVNLVSAQKTQALVRLQVQRGTSQLVIDVPLMAPTSPDSGPKIGIEVQTAGFNYHPPFPVSIVTDKIAGGPSAGLMFTLSVDNALTSSNLTGGWKIAGTGTINLDGSVGAIGGVKEKVFAAEAVGASYFLCPVANYQDALSVARTIKVIQVVNVGQAIAFLRSLPAR